MKEKCDELLEAMGFRPVGDTNILIFRQTPEDVDKEATVYVEITANGFIGHIPYVGQELKDEIPGQTLKFHTEDVRDIVALAQNEIGASLADIGDYSEEGFEHKGIFVTQPFCSDPWGDYQVDEKKNLMNPVEAYGDLYTEWRDDFCARILSGPTPRP